MNGSADRKKREISWAYCGKVKADKAKSRTERPRKGKSFDRRRAGGRVTEGPDGRKSVFLSWIKEK